MESIYQSTKELTQKCEVSVNSVLKIVGVSKSGYYAWRKRKPSKRQLYKEQIKHKIIQIYHESHQIYGDLKITSILREQGEKVTEKTVGNYMREEESKAIWVRPYVRTTIDPHFDMQLKNLLARQFNPSHPNAVWVTDITYVYTMGRFQLQEFLLFYMHLQL